MTLGGIALIRTPASFNCFGISEAKLGGQHVEFGSALNPAVFLAKSLDLNLLI
jgi:hypothetical protein